MLSMCLRKLKRNEAAVTGIWSVSGIYSVTSPKGKKTKCMSSSSRAVPCVAPAPPHDGDSLANPPLPDWYGIIPKPKISLLKPPSCTPFARSPFTIRWFPQCVFTPFLLNIIPMKFSSLDASNSQRAWRLSLSHNVALSLVPITNWQIWRTTLATFSQGKERTALSNFRPTFLGFFRVIFYPSHGVIY